MGTAAAGRPLSSPGLDADGLPWRQSKRRRFLARPEPAVPAEAILRAAEILAEAERPIILAGGGALWSGAAEVVELLARTLAAPVVTTLNGKGLLDERNPLSFGHARSARGRHLWPHADAVLAVGCRFTEVMTDWRRMTVPKNLIQIDLDPEQIGMNHPVVVGIVADARTALSRLGRGAAPEAGARRLGQTVGRCTQQPALPSRSG